MGQKKIKGRHDPFWTIFGSLKYCHLFFWRRNASSGNQNTWRLERFARGNLAGFTLIELIVGIGILSVFSTFLVASINPFEQFKKTADAQRKNDLSQIQKALEAYYQDFGKYPESSNDKIVYNSSVLDWGSSWTPYMDVLPKDPKQSWTYVYATDNNQQSYWFYASFERGGKDPQACKPDGSSCPNVPAGVTCGFICSYGVSSPNVSP